MAAICDSCGAPVIWVHTTTGKAMPVDERPVEDGNVVLTGAPATVPVAHVIAKGEHVAPTTLRFKSHFATCPHAAQHRRKK